MGEIDCEGYEPDALFQQFKLIEFPTSFVGLASSLELDVETNLDEIAYIKTMCGGKLVQFEEARLTSGSHRSFLVSKLDDHTLTIKFNPTAECVSKAMRDKQPEKRFVVDLRLLKITNAFCCYNELHLEVGRYYLSGQFVEFHLTNQPHIVNFGNLIVNQRTSTTICVTNHSTIAAKVKYVKVAGFNVVPSTFTLHASSTKKLIIELNPTTLKLEKVLEFLIRNPHDSFEKKHDEETKENHLVYKIRTDANIAFGKTPEIPKVESLHKLYEKLPKYTYIGKELINYTQNKKTALKFFEVSKATHVAKVKEKIATGLPCYSEILLDRTKQPREFCQIEKETITIYDIINVTSTPVTIDFGRVGLQTYGEETITLENKTKYDISLTFCEDNFMLYTSDKYKVFLLNMKGYSKYTLAVFCYGATSGTFKGTFKYLIDEKFDRKLPYSLSVGQPMLMVKENILKFGMITADIFVTSVSLRVYNNFNVPVGFSWDLSMGEAPFKIIPLTGQIPRHSCKICDIYYDFKTTKSKTHEVGLVSQSTESKVIPIELHLITRKISMKFLQNALNFNEIPLNLSVKRCARLENSSREIAVFYVVEPLLPGMEIIPMSGTIKPKSIITFDIIIKIACVLDFSFDMIVKINNRENIILPMVGSVLEPKISVNPRNIYLARIPSFLLTYIPVNISNAGTLKSVIDILDLKDDNLFQMFTAHGQEKVPLSSFTLEPGQSKVIYIQVTDVFRREYEMFLPIQVNNLLGPPNLHIPKSLEIQYYTTSHDSLYENNVRYKTHSLSKEISYCKISGVITIPWINISVDNFVINYSPDNTNFIEFTITNISKYILPVTIQTSKLQPNFSLQVIECEDVDTTVNENAIKFSLDLEQCVSFKACFHPRGLGKYTATAIFFLDKAMMIPYSNLTFIGKRLVPLMTANTSYLIFPPCQLNTEIVRYVELTLHEESDLHSFSYIAKDEPYLEILFVSCDVIRDDKVCTKVKVRISINCNVTYYRTLALSFHNDVGSSCDIDISFCYSNCPITLHALSLVSVEKNPFPYYPEPSQEGLHSYMNTTLIFLEKWMFQQGFRREFFPDIPETFHSISTSLTSQARGIKTKGLNMSYLNFIKRITGPLMKHIRKTTALNFEEPLRSAKEIHDTYREIVYLLKGRGSNLWTLQAKYLLSYDQFVIFTENAQAKSIPESILIKELVNDRSLFERLNKQAWIDFILQTYKVFVVDSCFFECVCISEKPRDIIPILLNWFNSVIVVQHRELRGVEQPIKVVKNLTTDLMDGIAIISAILNFCPFLKSHFSIFAEVEGPNDELNITHNACLILEAMNTLKFFFPVTAYSFINPNFIEMLFLSIHLYVVLPMFNVKDTVCFEPPLLRSSTRLLSINPTTQEALSFSFMLINNSRNGFLVEKTQPAEGSKKNFLMVKYSANFVTEERTILLIHGYNKARIFDTYIVFVLVGKIGDLEPFKKCKVTGHLYRAHKGDITLQSPFSEASVFTMSLINEEPTMPVKFTKLSSPKFNVQRLNLIDTEICLPPYRNPKESSQDVPEYRVMMHVVCLSTQIENSWIWFRSSLGEFFVKVTSYPRYDIPVDILQPTLPSWPLDPCSCGEECECYRTAVLHIPHKNENMIKTLRYGLSLHASATMLDVFDRLVDSTTGRIIILMLLRESGTNLSEISHILASENRYRVSARGMTPRLEYVTLRQHTRAMVTLPVTLPPTTSEKSEKHSVTFTSECGMDIRTFKVVFRGENMGAEDFNSA